MNAGIVKRVLFGAVLCAAVTTVACAGWKMSSAGPWRARTYNWKVSGNGVMQNTNANENGTWVVNGAGTHATWDIDGQGVIKAEWDPGYELYRTPAGFTLEFLRGGTPPDDIAWTWNWRDPDGQLLAQGTYVAD
jgi:hypothetical protein